MDIYNSAQQQFPEETMLNGFARAFDVQNTSLFAPTNKPVDDIQAHPVIAQRIIINVYKLGSIDLKE